ncbi:hypothetical protein JJE66_33855 [Bradyrhizobium diazoefficiens]|uniref:hypothetical protein n=1 Tax=Bradyrhizobium diazoefficiens TaxID=1355477 RepID=UPI00190960A4|nr:hypothetical protein [Bradyrhizobium diazoefficiens]MBK3666194.1 hypothetical protein [Bradyrhizobium diazoefficiens]
MPLIRFTCCNSVWDEDKWFSKLSSCEKCGCSVVGERAPQPTQFEIDYYQSKGVNTEREKHIGFDDDPDPDNDLGPVDPDHHPGNDADM